MGKDDTYLSAYEASKLDDIPFSNKKIQNLADKGYISVKDNLISLYELRNLVLKENDLKENYITSRQTLKLFGFGYSNTIRPFEDGMQRLSEENLFELQNYRGILYINKKQLEIFQINFIQKTTLLLELDITLQEYESYKQSPYFLGCGVNFQEVRITDKIIFLSREVLHALRNLFSDYVERCQLALEIRIAKRVITNMAEKENIETIRVSREKVFYPRIWAERIKLVYGTTKTLSKPSDTYNYKKLVELEKDLRYQNLRSGTLRSLLKNKIIESKIFDDGFVYVYLPSLQMTIDLEERLRNEYYDFGEVCKHLWGEIQLKQQSRKYGDSIIQLVEKGIFREFKTPILKSDIFIEKSSVKDFKAKYESILSLSIRFDIDCSKILNLCARRNTEVVMFAKGAGNREKQFCIRDIVVPLIEDFQSNYCTKSEAMKELGLTLSQYQELNKEGAFGETIRFSGDATVFIQKSIIHNLFQEKKILIENYYSANVVREMYGLHKIDRVKELQKIVIKGNALMRAAHNSKNENYYPKEKIDYLLEKRQIEQQISQISYEDPLEAFKSHLTIYNLYFAENAPLTRQTWMEYCHFKLKTIGGREPHKVKQVKRFVDITKILVDLTHKKELYALTANEINLAIFNENVTVSAQKIAYTFIKEFKENLTANGKNHVFKFEWIINPYKYESEQMDKAIYEYGEYKRLFQYTDKTSFHKKKCITDLQMYIRQGDAEKCGIYASSWLYVLIHLNNAWRHSDVVFNLPRINLDDLSFVDGNWFLLNDLPVEQAKSIVNQLMRNDYTVSKTLATANFYCSEKLTMSVATAAVFCELCARVKDSNRVIDKEEDTKITHLIDFNNKKQEFTIVAQRGFFSEYEDPEFRFQSRKMNRSILSYLYIMLIKQGKHNAALEVAQRLRAHENYETTNIYIDIPDNEINHLTKQLFQRKHFGYITNLVAEAINGNSDDREQRTQEIVQIRNTLGNSLKLEVSSGFINRFNRDKQLVAEKILKMGVKEASELMFNITADLLPGKDENYNCFYTDCVQPGKKCEQCPFSIPNFYALSSLAKSIEDKLKEFNELFESASLQGERARLSNNLYILFDRLEEAIHEFGHDEVFKFFNKEKSGFVSLLEKLDELNVDIESITTYRVAGGNKIGRNVTV